MSGLFPCWHRVRILPVLVGWALSKSIADVPPSFLPRIRGIVGLLLYRRGAWCPLCGDFVRFSIEISCISPIGCTAPTHLGPVCVSLLFTACLWWRFWSQCASCHGRGCRRHWVVPWLRSALSLRSIFAWPGTQWKVTWQPCPWSRSSFQISWLTGVRCHRGPVWRA